MNEQANVAKHEVLFIMRHDISYYTDDEQRFIRNNYTTYDVALNTWLRIVDDCCGLIAVRSLKGALMAKGVISTVADCCDTADALIRHDINYEIPDFCRSMIVEDEASTLQALRYLKRFTPVGADKLNERGIDTFLKLNLSRRTPASVIDSDGKVLKRSPIGPRWLLNAVREKCHQIIGECDITYDHCSFSSGTCAGGERTIVEKLNSLADYMPNLADTPLYPISKVTKDIDLNDLCVKLVAVPKNYKVPRIIAELPAVCAYFQQSVRWHLEQSCSNTALGSRIHLDDQSFNKELCRLGSVYNVYATIDLSGASDSISDALAEYVLPRNVYDEITRWNPKFMDYRGKKYRRFIFQTSGNATTFIAETIIFLAVTYVATEYYTLFTGYTGLTPLAYGDDMICDAGVYDTLCDFLEMLGFTVNLEKSFGSASDYRESCGAEYRQGISLVTRYYPRKPIGPDNTLSLSSLISLQHHIFGFVSAENWLTTYLQKRFMQMSAGAPTLTSSPIGADCDDIWDYTPFYRTVNAPYDHTRMETCDIKREIHLHLEAKYPACRLDGEELERLNVYYYTHWLRDGAPLIEYGDTLSAKLAEVNHWTRSCVDVCRDSGLPEYVWRPTIR